eukprot:2330273-Karenia_brevis.AAC.1
MNLENNDKVPPNEKRCEETLTILEHHGAGKHPNMLNASVAADTIFDPSDSIPTAPIQKNRRPQMSPAQP